MTLYRIKAYELHYGEIKLKTEGYEVVKETWKGYWVQDDWGRKRWMNKTATRRFAWSTEEEAMKSFIRRTQHHIGILENRLAKARAALYLAQQ